MRFNGEWLQGDDGIFRPIVRAEIFAGDENWRAFELLVDTGADRTVISANVLESLKLDVTTARDRIGGVGGLADVVAVRTQIRLTRDDRQSAIFRGEYAACVNHESLDMSVMGRDILEMFALIMDRSANLIAIVGGNHRYTIDERT
jgi:hypothetical protein